MSAKTFDRHTAKFLAVVGENMPKMSEGVMQAWIENPKGLQWVLAKAFLASDFKVWKTIKFGTELRAVEDFRRALKDGKDGGFQVSGWANDMLGQSVFTAATEETEVDLVVVSVAELGFKGGAYTRDIYKRAQEFGLELCPSEVGPQLRLQYKDQPMEEWLLIGMEPITDSDGILGVFYVERDGHDLWLGGYDGRPGCFWHGCYRWVFVRPASTGA